MKYNTRQKELILPDYGRNIHRMIEYCTNLESKDERMRCSNAIINLMGNAFPHLRDVSDFKHLLWDHLIIMSDFKLDIDSPYEIVKKENLYSRPAPLKYKKSKLRYRHYGRTIENIISIIPTIEDELKKNQLINLVALQMKKSYIHWNKEVDDSKIFQDLYELSDRQIDIRNSGLKLSDGREKETRRQNVSNANSNYNRRKRK